MLERMVQACNTGQSPEASGLALVGCSLDLGKGDCYIVSQMAGAERVYY